MTISKTLNGSEAVVAVAGWLDTQASPELLAELDRLEEGVMGIVKTTGIDKRVKFE